MGFYWKKYGRKVRGRIYARSTRKSYPGFRMFRGVRRTRGSIFKRFIKRTALKPELKYVLTTSSNTTAGGTPFTFALTPAVLGEGTGISARVGNQVSFIKFDTRLEFKNNSPTTTGAAPVVQSGRIRVCVWTPRIDFTRSLAYMNSIDMNTHIDYNAVTLLKDFQTYLSPPYMAEATSNDIAGGPFPYARTIPFTQKFPRKVKFGGINDGGISTLDEEKETCYLTFYSDLNVAWLHNTKLWYFDS